VAKEREEAKAKAVAKAAAYRLFRARKSLFSQQILTIDKRTRNRRLVLILIVAMKEPGTFKGG
jgi:hypothetical protein